MTPAEIVRGQQLLERYTTLNSRVRELVEQLEAAGFIVTHLAEVERAGAARILGVSPKTLRNWASLPEAHLKRMNEIGPPYREISGLAFYPLLPLLLWIEERDEVVLGSPRETG